ncbi:MAG: CvpA family protein [Gammaproteobacteria bacterium]|jgi:membrane protein required for colicin V production|nr:CvpA family protein [Gammaproteobacteria bacterium]
MLNWLDWVIIVVLAVSTLLSVWRGFAREAISLAAWVAAFVVANLFVDQMASLLATWISNITGRYVAAYAILFVGTLMLGSLLGMLARQLVKVTGLSVLDRLLGTVFGFARGVILILVCAFVLRQLVPPGDLQWLHQSQLMPQLDMLAQWTQNLFRQLGAPQWSGMTT